MSKKFVNFHILLIISLITFLVVRCASVPVQRHQLSVHVVYLLDGTPVTGATVEVVSLSERASNDSDGRVIACRSLNDEGWALFRLPADRYLARMRSGYTGQTKINLEEDKEVVLTVIPVLR